MAKHSAVVVMVAACALFAVVTFLMRDSIPTTSFSSSSGADVVGGVDEGSWQERQQQPRQPDGDGDGGGRERMRKLTPHIEGFDGGDGDGEGARAGEGANEGRFDAGEGGGDDNSDNNDDNDDGGSLGGGGGEGGGERDDDGSAYFVHEDTRIKLSGKWGKMDVRDASDLTPDAFYDEYVAAGVPVIIRGDVAATEFAAKWDVDQLVSKCGSMRPNFGIRVLSFLENLSPEQYASFDERLSAVSGGGRRGTLDFSVNTLPLFSHDSPPYIPQYRTIPYMSRIY